MFSQNSLNSVTKIFVTIVKGLEPATQAPLVLGCYHSASRTHVRDRIFKLTPIHTSVVIRFPELTEFSEGSALLRKNSRVSVLHFIAATFSLKRWPWWKNVIIMKYVFFCILMEDY